MWELAKLKQVALKFEKKGEKNNSNDGTSTDPQKNANRNLSM